MLVRIRERRPLASAWDLEGDLDRIFRSVFDWGTPARGPMDVAADAEGVTVRVELPGVDPAAIKIGVENGTLSIRAERSEEQRSEGRYHLRERAHGAVAHAFRLADDLDTEAISAECHNGVLTVRIPKRAEAKPRQIEIKTN